MVGRLWVRSPDSVTETAPGCIFRTIGQASSPGVQAEAGRACAASINKLVAASARPRLRFRQGIAGASMSGLLDEWRSGVAAAKPTAPRMAPKLGQRNQARRTQTA